MVLLSTAFNICNVLIMRICLFPPTMRYFNFNSSFNKTTVNEIGPHRLLSFTLLFYCTPPVFLYFYQPHINRRQHMGDPYDKEGTNTGEMMHADSMSYWNRLIVNCLVFKTYFVSHWGAFISVIEQLVKMMCS